MGQNKMLTQQPYSMGKVTHSMYNELIEYFKNETPGYYDNFRAHLRDPINVAGTIAHFFPAHYYKLVHLFSNLTDYLSSIKNIIILDIGAGIGTTYYSLLDVCNENNIKFDDAYYIYVDGCDSSIKYRNICIESRTKLTKDEMFNIIFIEKDIPYCIKEILNHLSTFNDYHVLICMSNILKHIPNEIDCIDSIYEIIKNSPQVEFSIINIEPEELKDKLNNFIKQIDKNIFIIDILPDSQISIDYINPRNSPYRKKYNRNRYFSKFYSCLTRLGTYLDNKCTEKDIKSIFHSTINEYEKRAFYDVVELKLYYKSYDSMLSEINHLLKDGYIYNSEYLEFYIPKKNGTRPFVIENLLNEIISSILLKYWASEINKTYEQLGCYGNIVDKNKYSSKIYHDYYEQYFNKFLKKAQKYKKRYKYYAKIDMKSFYSNIDKTILLNSVCKHINTFDKKFLRTVSSLINRSWNGCDNTKGIAQGTLISGFLANAFLHNLDVYFSNNTDSVKYIRYVDDIFIFANSEEVRDKYWSEAKKILKEKCGLDIHDSSNDVNKNQRGQSKDLVYIEVDKEIDELSRTLRTVFESLYYITNKSEYERFVNNKLKYSEIYSICLKKIGINLAPNYIHRKLHKNTILNTFRRCGRYALDWLTKKGFTVLKWVDLPCNEDQPSNCVDAISFWGSLFESENPRFINLLNSCRDKLKSFFIHELVKYVENPEEENIINTRRLKFAINKLGTLKVYGIENQLYQLLYRPWLLPHGVIRAYPELKEYIYEDFMLYKSFNTIETEYYYLRSIWLLGEWKTSEKITLELVTRYVSTLNYGTDIENVLLVEALLKKEASYILGIKKEIKDFIISQEQALHTSYVRLRGAYILLKYACPKFDKNLCFDKFKNNFRFSILYDVLLNENPFNPLDVEEEQIKDNDMLPDYFHEDYNVV
ncbi:MAG: reverse transcriptase domain-containing protein [Clostridia bacterium]|nr:reverse transcriptase domain-containing protein [Clostridia bacterium]